MSKNHYKKALFDVINNECEAMIPDTYEDHIFSPKFEKKMRKLISRHKKPYYRFISTGARRAACIVVALLVFSASAMSVKAVREAVLDFIMHIFSDHTEVKTDIGSGEDYPETIEEEYYISELPEGFEMVNHYSNSFLVHSLYKNEDEYIILDQYTREIYYSNYDTERKDQNFIEIDGQEYLFFSTNIEYTYIWDNGKYIFMMISNCDKDRVLDLCKATKSE